VEEKGTRGTVATGGRGLGKRSLGHISIAKSNFIAVFFLQKTLPYLVPVRFFRAYFPSSTLLFIATIIEIK